MSKKDAAIAERARQKVQEKISREERNRDALMFRQRIEVARAGVLFYQHGKYKEALEHYYKYLGILERSKNLKSGQLEIKHFDTKKDIAELLLLSGIFWDIAKLTDRSKKKDKTQLKIYLDKFVMFSKGMPYQHMCTELMRKYLMNDRPLNRTMFKDTYIRLGGGKCFIATSVEEYCNTNTLNGLRKFRDEKLLKNIFGSLFVRFYYSVGPHCARLILRMPVRAQMKIASSIDFIATKLA